MNFRSYECPVRSGEQVRMDYKFAFDEGVCFERVRTNVQTNGEGCKLFRFVRNEILCFYK